jgi:hypothetical protein
LVFCPSAPASTAASLADDPPDFGMPGRRNPQPRPTSPANHRTNPGTRPCRALRSANGLSGIQFNRAMSVKRPPNTTTLTRTSSSHAMDSAVPAHTCCSSTEELRLQGYPRRRLSARDRTSTWPGRLQRRRTRRRRRAAHPWLRDPQHQRSQPDHTAQVAPGTSAGEPGKSLHDRRRRLASRGWAAMNCLGVVKSLSLAQVTRCDYLEVAPIMGCDFVQVSRSAIDSMGCHLRARRQAGPARRSYHQHRHARRAWHAAP